VPLPTLDGARPAEPAAGGAVFRGGVLARAGRERDVCGTGAQWRVALDRDAAEGKSPQACGEFVSTPTALERGGHVARNAEDVPHPVETLGGGTGVMSILWA
jgi:hypothetical protein